MSAQNIPHEKLLNRGHWTEERIDLFFPNESGTTRVYPLREIRKIERSDAYKALWQREKQEKQALRDAPKITPTRLIEERGWTKGLIKDLLGEPDATARNPHYSTAAPMRLYLISRVEKAEESAEFQSRKKDRTESQLVKNLTEMMYDKKDISVSISLEDIPELDNDSKSQ